MRASKPTMKILGKQIDRTDVHSCALYDSRELSTVAKILPMNPSGCTECAQRVINLNNAIPAWAKNKTTSASPITVVDLWTGFNTATDTGDGVHPNESGNAKIAASYYQPLYNVL
jgi:hypothetical protein